MTSARSLAPLAVALALVALPAAAAACPVCWGDSDSPLAYGVNQGIIVLLGITLFVLGGFGTLILTIRRRTKRYEKLRGSFRVVEQPHDPGKLTHGG